MLGWRRRDTVFEEWHAPSVVVMYGWGQCEAASVVMGAHNSAKRTYKQTKQNKKTIVVWLRSVGC